MATTGTHDTEPMSDWWESVRDDERAAVARAWPEFQGVPVTKQFTPEVHRAMLAAAQTETWGGRLMGVLAVALAAVNIFGGFLVTRRMLEMFRKKERKAPAEKPQ